jgi:hypothetical protein
MAQSPRPLRPVEPEPENLGESIAQNGSAMLDLLLKTADQKKKALEGKTDETLNPVVVIKRSGFSFKMRPIDGAEIEACRERSVRWGIDRATRARIEQGVNREMYRSLVIYTATVPDPDGTTVWDKAGPALGLAPTHNHEAIDQALLLGEKDQVFDLLTRVSGYALDTEEQQIETAKN